ncbi:MAG: hypothetical protein MJ102_04440 [Clostridia bacterium]|nr:hypothetical protein [Clostridia bacterium]
MDKAMEKDGFFRKLINETVTLFKNPKKLIPTFVLAGLWILLSLLTAFGVTPPFVKILNVITFSGGGMYGGLLGAIGGIFGKALFAAFVTGIVNAIVKKEKPLSDSGKGIKALFDKSVFSGLNAISAFVLFAGIGILLNLFFNVTSNPQNCAISFVCLLGTVTAMGSRHGLLFTVLFKLLGIFTKGKAPSMTAVNRALTGLSAGFTLGFSLTFARLPWLTALIGGVLAVGGIVCAVIGRTPKVQVSSFCIV